MMKNKIFVMEIDETLKSYPYLYKCNIKELGEGLSQLFTGVMGLETDKCYPNKDGYILLTFLNNINDTYIIVYDGELSYDNIFIIQFDTSGEIIYGQGDKWLVDTGSDMIDLIDEYYDNFSVEEVMNCE